MAQSKVNSFKEAVVNTGIGFGLSFLLQAFLAHAYGTSLTLCQNIQITIWFTILSLLRSYVVRRWFNKKEVIPPYSFTYVTNLNKLAAKHWEWVEVMGWHKTTVLERLALIASEVGEAVNECRGKEPTEKFPKELADIILRVVDLSHACGIDLDKVVEEKMAENAAKGNYKQRLN